MVVEGTSTGGGWRFQKGRVIMCSVFDVAAYILGKKIGRSLPHMKLQKLVYYSQAWSLVWDEKPLFSARIEAWANGPVVRTLYARLRKQFTVPFAAVNGDPTKLNQTQRDTVDSVHRFYGPKPSQWLSDLTHMEYPWQNARTGLSPGDRGTNEITLAVMAEYYGSL